MILRGDLYSKVLEMETGISIVSPANYRIRGTYRVCYLFHGLMGNSGSWLNNTMLNTYADRYNMIFIMPEVQRSFYFDQRYGLDYFTYLVDELPVIVETMFNVSKRREDTIVMGSSMGAYGALRCILSRPDLYSECFAFSPALLYLDEFLRDYRDHRGDVNFKSIYGRRFLTDLKGIFGEDLEETKEDLLLTLAACLAKKDQLAIHLYCGLDDYLLEDSRRFKSDLMDLGYKVDYREWEGDHNWNFFDQALERALEEYFKI